MMSLDGKHIGFIGAGAMASALAGGLRTAGIPSERIFASDPDARRRDAVSKDLGIAVGDDNAELAARSDVVVIAVKPNIVTEAVGAARAAGVDVERPVWISIAAGVTLARLEAAIGGSPRVVRAMPNTPALVGAGATAFCANRQAGPEDSGAARALFEAVGVCWEAPDEGMLDAVTGLSGSGPAYVFLLLEALAEAGVAQGLPEEAAAELASQTVFGAAKLARESDKSPAALREQVSSPGGTTVAGLEHLREGRFPETVVGAVAVATARSRELGVR
ncbi:MAG: pyrroline-5-carboxylate reductase [Myxococcales bacterium]|nr:pyrroline-5-carboxylate reductase [Myxococcales bacterium]